MFMGQASHPAPSSSCAAPTAQSSAIDKTEWPSKKVKVLVSKPPFSAAHVALAMTTPCKGPPASIVPEKEAPSKVSPKEGSSRHRDKSGVPTLVHEGPFVRIN
ncbi:hypothetical protein BHE74_00003527 [Ensete ventricosum]|nr:hypothetical protein BHE74_00003527 [Ensete ventricosum]